MELKEKLCLRATAIGSLPHDNPNDALELIFDKLPNFPIWPQLSKVNPNEDMIIQYTQNIPGAVFDETDNRWYLDPEKEDFYEKLEEFFLDYENIVNEGDLEALDKYAISGVFSSSLPIYLEKIAKTKPVALKGHITGPFTWGTSLIDRSKKCAFYDETLREIIVKGLTLKALWQVVQFKKQSPDSIPVIFLDEPSMSQFGTSAFITVSKEDIVNAISEITSVLRKNGAIVGIHCCGKTDWSLVIDCDVDLINFDAIFFAESFSLYASEVSKFLKKGGYIAWGVVPTLDVDSLKSTTAEKLAEKFEYAKNLLVKKGVDEDLIIKSSLITPTCGAGGLSVELAALAMDYLSQIETILRNKYLTKVGS
jgi:hypothetical protein